MNFGANIIMTLVYVSTVVGIHIPVVLGVRKAQRAGLPKDATPKQHVHNLSIPRNITHFCRVFVDESLQHLRCFFLERHLHVPFGSMVCSLHTGIPCRFLVGFLLQWPLCVEYSYVSGGTTYITYIGIPTVRNQIQEDSRPIPSDDGQMMGQL